jgi:cysteine desulfurase / selenocysteine lyase
MSSNRIYLDNAATSWPKPDAVYEAVDQYMRESGAPNGRSGYREAVDVDRLVTRTRRSIAELVGVDDPTRVVFTYSGTDAVNTAIFGIVRPGDHVVTTVCDHNSVLRPLRHLSETAGVTVTYVPCDSDGFVSPNNVRSALRPNTRLVAVVHGSNVTGALQPVDAIGEIVRQHGAYYLIDAAQSLGEVPLTMSTSHADAIAAPGHKGLLGPLGTGVLCMSERAAHNLKPLRFGGTGTSSEEDRQPDELPHRFEPGNLNIVGIAGLNASLTFLRERGIDTIRAHHEALASRLLGGLSEIAGAQIHGPKTATSRTSVVSVTLDGYDPQELAAMLEMTAGVECRAGLHCAPRMHEVLGTLARGGTVRLSPGWATTAGEIDSTLAAIEQAAAVAIR